MGGLKISSDNTCGKQAPQEPPRSKATRLNKLVAVLRSVAAARSDDLIQVYAAQASFYIVIAAVPGLMLLISVLHLVLPDEIIQRVFGFIALLPSQLAVTLDALATDVFSEPGISLSSITAAAALWSVSRAVTSVGNGVRRIYGTSSQLPAAVSIIFSILYAALFIITLSLALGFLVFSEALVDILKSKLVFFAHISTPLTYSAVFIFLSLFFTLAYTVHAKTPRLRSPAFLKSKPASEAKPSPPPNAPRSFRANLPGGLTASAGWLIYSFFYSIYLKYFAFGASYLYGSLTAVILLLLWLYFCLMIMLSGAELNRYLYRRKQAKHPADPPCK